MKESTSRSMSLMRPAATTTITLFTDHMMVVMMRPAATTATTATTTIVFTDHMMMVMMRTRTAW